MIQIIRFYCEIFNTNILKLYETIVFSLLNNNMIEIIVSSTTKTLAFLPRLYVKDIDYFSLNFFSI